MQKTIIMTIGGVLATALMMGAFYVAGLMCQTRCLHRIIRRPWSGHRACLAIAAGAGAQVIVLWLVVGRMYSNRTFNLGLRIIASCVGCIALIVAAALGLAARG
ncbi:MAG: hypothetical protein QM811_19150 [Pirellulales bacterium]